MCGLCLDFNSNKPSYKDVFEMYLNADLLLDYIKKLLSVIMYLSRLKSCLSCKPAQMLPTADSCYLVDWAATPSSSGNDTSILLCINTYNHFLSFKWGWSHHSHPPSDSGLTSENTIALAIIIAGMGMVPRQDQLAKECHLWTFAGNIRKEALSPCGVRDYKSLAWLCPFA